MESETRKKSRRPIDDIAKAIYEVLPDQDLISTNEIAIKIGTNWETVRRCLEFIEWLQNQPRVESMREGSRRYGYRKEKVKPARRERVK